MAEKNILFFNVDDFGATGDGNALDTQAIQKAIDAAYVNGGGTVLFSQGKCYLTGTFYLKSGVCLHVSVNSTILGSRNLADYSTDTGLCPYYPETLDRCLIYARNCSNIAFSGRGTIDGGIELGSTVVPEEYGKRAQRERPMCIRLEHCENIVARDQLWTNARSWFSHFKNCSGIHLTGLRVLNKRQDGFNIESSSNIHISDCQLSCGDDAFAFTTNDSARPVKNVTVANCRVSSRWAGVRFGPLSRGDFQEVVFSNCIFEKCDGGGIKFDPLEGGEISNCIFSNIVMNDVVAPIVMVTGRWPEIGSREAEPPMMPPGRIRDILFSEMSIRAKGGSPRPDRGNVIYLHGYKDEPIKNVTLSNVDVTSPGGGTASEATNRELRDSCEMDWREHGYWTVNKDAFGIPPAYGIYLRHIEGLNLNNLRFTLTGPDERSAVFAYQSADINISNLTTKNHLQPAPIVAAKDCLDVHTNQVRSRDRNQHKAVEFEK